MAASRWMLLLGTAGMLAGLWLDARAGNLVRMLDLCLSAPPGLMAVLALHAAELPLAHLGMVAGGLAGLPWVPAPAGGRGFCVRMGRSLGGSAAMALGMAGGTLAFLQVAPWSAGAGAPAVLLAGMVIAMGAGMGTGMALLEAARRLWQGRGRLLNPSPGLPDAGGPPLRWQRPGQCASDP